MENESLMTISEVAELLKVSKIRAYEVVRKLGPPVRVNIGRLVRVNAGKMREWLSNGGNTQRA